MNWLDIVFLLIAILSVVAGVKKGFAREVVGLVAAFAGFFLALWFYGSAGWFLLPYVSHRGIANFLGFILIFAGVLVLGAIVGKVLSMLLKWAGLSWLDRVMGGGFGLLRALILAIGLVLALLAFSPKPPPRAVVGSRVAPYIIDAAHVAAYLAPREVREGVRENYGKVKDAWEEFLKKARKEKDTRRT
ncbi:MAG: CvpA family protein [Bryobacterales bacterium]|nr:CvpA family protein [Bryobacterales bacterium]